MQGKALSKARHLGNSRNGREPWQGKATRLGKAHRKGKARHLEKAWKGT
jgi:hypothetical protein